MKWFWYSLLGFILLMCSCGTKKSARLINEVSKEKVRTKLARFEVLKDTFNALRIETDKSELRIIETIKIVEYDAQSGKPIKETDAKREVVQDTDQVIAEEENQAVTHQNHLDVDHFIDASKKVESEVKEESEDASVAFWREIGRWIGIVIAFILAFKIFWRPLKKKF